MCTHEHWLAFSTAAIRTLTGERELAVGIVVCLQTHGSRANWHLHRHRLLPDGGFRPDGTFVLFNRYRICTVAIDGDGVGGVRVTTGYLPPRWSWIGWWWR